MYTISVGNAFGHSIYTDLMMQEITEGVNAAFDNIDKIFAEYHQSLLSPENMEAELFGEAQAPQQAQPQSKGIVASLGAAIRSLIDAFGKMISRLGEAFMSSDAKLRKQQEELQRQLAANPDLKKKVMALSAEGAIDLKDMKDINQLSAEVDKLMEEKDPKTLKGKLEKLKKEWDDPNGKFLKRITAVGTAVGLVTTIYKGYQALHGLKTEGIDHAKKSQDSLQGLYKLLRSENVDVNTVNNLEAKLAARKFEQGCYQQAVSIASHNSNELSKGLNAVLKYFGNKKDKNGNYKVFGVQEEDPNSNKFITKRSKLQKAGISVEMMNKLKKSEKKDNN